MTKKTLIIGASVAFVAVLFVAKAVMASTGNAAPLDTVTSVAVTAPGCPAFTRSLSIGRSGSDVTALQEYLNAQGYLSVNATGYLAR